MSWFVKILLEVIINKFTKISMTVYKNVMLKKGIRIKAEKNIGHIEDGDEALSNGDLDGWLEELDNEEN